jgi:tripartite-type tricarboxylate transporter receptor subunit TctC
MDSELVVSRFTVRFVGCFGALFAAALIGVLATAGAIAQRTDDSQTYPNRAVRIIVPFPPGGPTDILARVLAQRLSEVWGQPVVIENQPGANTAIAAARVAKMPPDGCTLLAAMDVTLVLNPLTARNLAYDPLKDFAPISLASKNTSLMSVRAEDGPRTVKELIARAKASPGKLNYGAGIITTRLAGYLFNREVELDAQYIPFNGSAPTVQGLLTGAVDYIIDGAATKPSLGPRWQATRVGQTQQPAADGLARGQVARRGSRHSGARRYLDLGRTRCARRHGTPRDRQDSARNR